VSRAAVAAGLLELAAARGLRLDPVAARHMALHLELLDRWNPTAKLTSLRSRSAILERHFLESLEGLRFLPAAGGAIRHLIDVGSGGGFPGLPLLMARPDLRGTLLEPASRKRAFLKEVVREAGLGERVRVLSDRMGRPEDVARHAPIDVLTLRAVAGSAGLLEAIAGALRPGGRLLLFLGQAGARAVRAALPGALREIACHPLPGRSASPLVVLGTASDPTGSPEP
jgi:16S rRNA (guanine527-N7)-methyltransferase